MELVPCSYIKGSWSLPFSNQIHLWSFRSIPAESPSPQLASRVTSKESNRNRQMSTWTLSEKSPPLSPSFSEFRGRIIIIMYLDPCLPLLKQGGLWHCAQRHGWLSWSIFWPLPAVVISNIAPYHSPDSERMAKMHTAKLACKRERERISTFEDHGAYFPGREYRD